MDTRLRSVMTRLEECQDILAESGEGETVQLVAMTILQLRMRLHHIGDAELKALCDAIEPEPVEQSELWKASGDLSS
jgi:hypothetical protein